MAKKITKWLALVNFMKSHIVLQVLAYLLIGTVLLWLLGYLDWLLLPKDQLTGPAMFH